MEPVRRALAQLLDASGPTTPALVMDGEYNLVMVNEGLARLIRLLGMPEAMLHQQPLNLLRVIFALAHCARCAWTKPGCAPRCSPRLP